MLWYRDGLVFEAEEDVVVRALTKDYAKELEVRFKNNHLAEM